jgi:hypothetical protein
MTAIPEAARRQCGAFTFEQASATGWTPAQLSRAVAAGELLTLRRGVYLAAEDLLAVPEPDRETFLLGRRGVAAALRVQQARVSHRSAAALHGLPVLSTVPDPCITLPPPRRTRPAGLHVHRQPMTPAELSCRFHIAVTSAARTCLDVTRECGLPAGLAVTDAALRAGLVTGDELSAASHRVRGRAGLADGPALIRMANGLSESPLESISRCAMRGLSVAPELQVPLFSGTGSFIARVDFFWRAAGLVGEADGRAKYTGDELYREKQRQDALVAAGYLVTRWDWATAMRPSQLRAQLEAQLEQARRLRAAGLSPA